MMIKVKETTMVKPAEKTPRQPLWLSVLDTRSTAVHTQFIYFYKSKKSSSSACNNFFDSNLLKEALSKVLVPFYPIAGRFRLDHGSGRLEIDCNEEGVAFVVAETNCVMDELGDFAPTPKLQGLVPTVDSSGGISSYPLLEIQVTYFKCGGVSLGIGVERYIVDGPSAFHFVNAWSEIARGLDLTTPPFLDRTILQSCNLPRSTFNQFEYQPHPTVKTLQQNTESQYENLKVSIFRITKEQLNILRAKTKEGSGHNTINYSTFVILAGHIWKCVCKARAQPDDQQTTLVFPVSGRYSRLQPPIPPAYFGNVAFEATPIAMAGDIKSKPLWYVVDCIHKILVSMDNNYLRATIDYLELQTNALALRHGAHTYKSANDLRIISWVGLQNYDADFGWGRPVFMGPGLGQLVEGKSYILPSTSDDGSLFVVITLQLQHMKVFEKLFYGCDEIKLVVTSSFRANL